VNQSATSTSYNPFNVSRSPLKDVEWLNGSVRSVPSSSTGETADVPLISPSVNLDETPAEYVYTSEYGVYSFQKTNPLVFNLSRIGDGTGICTGALAPASDTALTAIDRVVQASSQSFDSTVTYKVGNSSTCIQACLKADFSPEAISSNSGPKFSMLIFPQGKLNASTIWIEWILVTGSYDLRLGDNNASLATAGSSQAAPVGANGSVEIGSQIGPDTWMSLAHTNWNGETPENVTIGYVGNCLTVSGHGVSVRFPRGHLTVDPTVVLSGITTAYPRPASFHSIFFEDGAYWAFFIKNGQVYYSRATNLSAWGPAQSTGITPKAGRSFDVAVRDKNVLVSILATNSTPSYEDWIIWQGVIRKGAIQWIGSKKIFSPGTNQYPATIGSCTITDDEAMWASVIDRYPYGSYGIHVYRTFSISDLGNGNLTPCTLNQFSSIGSILVPQPGGRVTLIIPMTNLSLQNPYNETKFIEFDPNTGADLHVQHWVVRTLNAGQMAWRDPENISAVSTLNGTIYVAYIAEGGALQYKKPIDDPNFPPFTIGATSPSCPALSVDPVGYLHIVYAEGSGTIKYARALTNSHNWAVFGSPITLCQGTAIRKLQSSGFCSFDVLATWLQGTDTLCVGTVPIEETLQAYGRNSDPWNRVGMARNEPFEMALDASVSTGNGLLTIGQTDISVQGRGGLDLSISRIYSTPNAFLKGSPIFNYGWDGLFPISMAKGWNLDLPFLTWDSADAYDPLPAFLQLQDGERFLLDWDRNVYENHAGGYFKLTRTKDQQSGLFTYKLLVSDGTTYDFDTAGRPVAIHDAESLNAITMHYDSSTAMIDYITDGIGRVADFTYAPNGTLSSVSYAGRNIAYVVDSNSMYLLRVIDELGRRTSYEYDQLGLLTKIIYPTGGYVAVSYGTAHVGTDVTSQLVTSLKTYPDSTSRAKAVYFNYDVYQGRVSCAEARYYSWSDSDFVGRVLHNYNPTGRGYVMSVYDSTGNLMKVVKTKYTTAGEISCQEVYSGTNVTPAVSLGLSDDWGNLVYSRDPSGHEKFYTYLYTSRQNSFNAPADMDLLQSGKLFYENFDLKSYSSFSTSSGPQGIYRLNMSFEPWHSPSFELVYGGGSAVARKTLASSLAIYNFLAIDIAADSISAGNVLEIMPSSGSANIGVKIARPFPLAPPYFMISDYSSGSLVYAPMGPFGAYKSSEVGISITSHSSGGAYTYSAYIDGKLVLTGLKTLAGEMKTISLQRTDSGVLLADNIKVMTSSALWVAGIPLWYKAIFETRDGQYLDSWRTVDQTTGGSIDAALWCRYLPDVDIRIESPSGTTIGWYGRSQVWGGDNYLYRPAYDNSSFIKTRSGFGNTALFTQVYVNESWPASSTTVTPLVDDLSPWVSSDSKNASAGLKYHHSNYWSGAHYHGFDSSTSMSVDPDNGYIVQYVYIPEGQSPYQLMLGFKQSGLHAADWGPSLIRCLPDAYNKTMNSSVCLQPGRWSVLCMKASDLGFAVSSVTGVRYALYGGACRWDLLGTGSSDLVKITLEGVPTGYDVLLKIADTGKTYTITASSSSVAFNPYILAGITAYPITASFTVMFNGLVYGASPSMEMFGGDKFKFVQGEFGVHRDNDISGVKSHNLLSSTLEFENGRGITGSLTCRSYLVYMNEVFGTKPTSIMSLYNKSWTRTSYFEYDSSYGNLWRTADSDNVWTKYYFDSTYHAYLTATSQTDSTSGITYTKRYDFNLANGRLNSVTDPGVLAPTTKYTYDAIGRVVSITHPAVNGRSMHTNTTYDDVNHIMHVVRESALKGGEVVYTYDGLGRLIEKSDWSSLWQYEYDWNDNVDLAGQTAGRRNVYYTTTYDFLGRQTWNSVTDNYLYPDRSGWSKTIYDDTKRSWMTVDGCNHTVGYFTDVAGRVTSIRQYYSFGSASYNETKLSYDDSGNLIYTKDPTGEATTYEYDEMGRVIATHYPDGTVERKDLTPGGLPEFIFRRDGNVVRYSYDSLMRVKDVYFAGSANNKKHFVYDDAGQVSWANNTGYDGTVVTTERDYDAAGRLTYENSTVRGVKYTTICQYDLFGRMSNLTYPDSTKVAYSYDPLDQITSVQGYAVASYDNYGRPLDITYANGVSTDYVYVADKMIGETLQGSDSYRSITYTYWLDGNLKQESENVGSYTKNYTYDGQDRIKKVDGAAKLTYTFNSNGNWLSKTDGTLTTQYTYGKCNRITQYKTPAGQTRTLAYDKEGNLRYDNYSKRDYRVYDYDWENNLISVSINSSTATAKYWYDAFGRRVDTLEGSTRTIAVYLGMEPIYQKVIASKTTVNKIVYGPDGLILAKKEGSTQYYYQQNVRHDVIRITDSTKKTVWNAWYKPYGEAVTTVTPTFTPDQKFTGERYDSKTGLYNFGFRHYNPNMGRFMSEDPAGSSANQYTYCGGDPINLVDPDGLYSVRYFDLRGPVWMPEPKNDLLGVLVGFADTMMMVVGFVPGLDIISDLYFTARCALDGDWVAAGICLGCALVPGASAALYKVFKSGARAAKWIERGADASGDLTRTENRAIDIPTITRKLESHLNNAVTEARLTARQERAALANPSLRNAFMGERIDTLFKRSVNGDRSLWGVVTVTDRFERGADVYLVSDTRIWWDVTRPSQWGNHLERYGLGGIPLFY